MRKLLLTVIIALTLTACGYRTPLTLPPAKPSPAPKPPATAPEPAPAPAT